jgi:uncharacterized membrane protein HdeD (DUF308 family)
MATDGDLGHTWASEALRRHWAFMLALGILMVVLGMIGLVMAATFTIASVLVFGALLVVGGIAQVVEAFRATGWRSTALHVFIALVYIAAGAIALYDPVAASLSLTLFIAAMLIVAGVLRVVMALQMRPVRGWVWVLGGGILSVLLAVAILVQWPVSGLLAIGLFVAIELLIDGWSCILFALAARSPAPGDGGRLKHA